MSPKARRYFHSRTRVCSIDFSDAGSTATDFIPVVFKRTLDAHPAPGPDLNAYERETLAWMDAIINAAPSRNNSRIEENGQSTDEDEDDENDSTDSSEDSTSQVVITPR